MLKKIIIGLLLFNSTTVFIFSKSQTYRVFFKDKGNEAFVPNSEIYHQTLKLFNNRAINRRLKVLTKDSLIVLKDAPIYKKYIDTLISNSAEILLKLRWNNYAVVRADTNSIEKIKNFKFVKHVQTTNSKYSELSRIDQSPPSALEMIQNCGSFDYGESFFQEQELNIPKIHSLGITGQGVLIGFLDSGFRWKKNRAFQNTNIANEFDFVYNDSLTANDSNDISNQDHHGTITFSTLATYLPGEYIGSSPSSTYLLAKTENLKSESHFEEDCYAAGVEWMESQGVDIITSSLGYFTMNIDSSNSYLYSELDGEHTIPDMAVNYAVSRGVVCITSAGNNGPDSLTLITPADADSVISVAAMVEDGINPAKFSSRGPTGVGKIKPDIAALGVNVRAINVDGDIVNTGGTSLSAPQIAGFCSLIISAFPELKPWEIRTLLYNSANNSNAPNVIIGHGKPDLYKAMTNAGIIISPIATLPTHNFQRVFCYIISEININKATLNIKFANTYSFANYKLNSTIFDNLYVADIPLDKFKNKSAEYFIVADNLTDNRRMPYKIDSTLLLTPYQNEIPCGIDENNLPRIPENFTQCSLNPTLITNSTDNITITTLLNQPSNISVKIYDLTARLCFEKKYPSRDVGIESIQIPIRNFLNGNYFVIVNFNDKNRFLKFMVAR